MACCMGKAYTTGTEYAWTNIRATNISKGHKLKRQVTEKSQAEDEKADGERERESDREREREIKCDIEKEQNHRVAYGFFGAFRA